MSFNGWKRYVFSDFVNINPSVRLEASKYYSFVEMKDLNEKSKFVYPSAKRKLTGGSRFQNYDTLFARITPCLENGKICQVKELENGVGFGSTEFLVFRGREGISDNNFVFYLMRYDEVRRFAEQNMLGTSGRQRVTWNAFVNLKLDLPPLPTQRRIASILSGLDNKIELNRQTNATLEAMAQAIFKEWFVDFRFPGATGEMVESELGMIPRGWRVLPLDEIAKFLNGLALQKFPPENDHDYLPVIKIRELRNGVTDSSDRASKNIPEEYIIHDGDLIFSWSGTLEVKFWVGGKGALNQHLFKVTSKEYPLWFCYFWLLHHLEEFRNIAKDKTTTMGHIQRGHLSSALCLIPNNLYQPDSVIRPIIDKVVNNEKEMFSLAQIRDSLLPKLMSGEIEV